jgi:simple sugar transport system permease protein
VQSAAPTPAPAPAVTPPGQESVGPSLTGRIARLFLYQREVTPFVLTILVLVGFLLWKGTVVTSQLNLSSAAGYAGPIGAIAIAQVLLLVLAEIDLSAGAVFLFAPWIEYWLNGAGVPLVLAILMAIVASALVGGFNGLITVFLRVPSFVTTLATNFILFGGILVGSNDAQVSPVPLSGGSGIATSIMGGGQWAEIIWVAALTVVLAVVLTRTRFGVRIIATGGNLVGAAEAGVPIRRVKVWAFMLASSVAGLVGIVDAVKYGSLQPGQDGVDYILFAVGACVIGGTALTGGRGTVVGAFIGAILLGIIESGLTVAGISTNDFYICVGVVIIFAMALNVQFDRVIARSKSRQ